MTKEHSSKKYRIEQFYAIRQLTALSLSPDGKTIAYITNTNGLPNIWTIPIEGGWSSQITLQENAVKYLSYSPSKNEIIFQADVNGDENSQIYLISDKGGEAKNLTQGHSGSQTLFCCWNKKGTKILFGSNKRDKRFFDTYIYDLKTDTEECIYSSNDIYAELPASWSKDEKYILFNKFYNNSDMDVLLYNIKTGKMKNITKHEGPMKNLIPQFNKKNDTVYFLSDYEREFIALAYYMLKGQEIGWTVKEKWDISGYRLSISGKYILYSINENGSTKLKLKNLSSGKLKKLKIPNGNCVSFEITPDDKKVVMIFDSPKNPNDIFVYDIKKEKMEQVTFSMIGGIPSNDFVNPAQIKYKSFDGLEISAWLYIPKSAKKDGTNAAIVWPHGGPEWQEKYLFNKYFQILVNLGYVIIAPNFRGSTGYGKTFQRKIYKDWGGAEFRDVIAAYDSLINSGYADKNKIAIVGGSFGGFMTLTCVTKAPDLWKCAIDIFGPSNLFTFLNSIPEHWKPGTNELIGNTEIDKAMLCERSPINFVDKIKCPIFIVQGANDPRVVQKESDQIVEKLKSADKTVEYLVLEDEGHGFSKVSNQVKVWEMISKFLQKYLA